MADAGYINALLEGVRMHTERQLRQKSLVIEQQRADAQTEQEKARIEQQKQQLEETKRQFDAQHELVAKAAKLTHLQQLQQITEGFSKTNQTPPGAIVTPTNPEAGIGTMTLPKMGFSGEDVTMPIQTRQAAAAQTADTYRIANAPIEEHQIKIEAAKQAEILKSRLEEKKADSERFRMQKEYDDLREKQRSDAEFQREVYRQQQENYRERLKQQGAVSDLTPYLNMLQTGEMTREDLNKTAMKPQDKAQITNAVIGGGGRILKEADKSSILDMATISTAIPRMDEALDILKANPVQARIPGTDAYKKYQEAVQQAELVLPQVGRVIAGDRGRLSNQQIAYAQGSFIPSRNPLSAGIETNIKNRDDFVRTMKDILENKLAGMSPKHKAFLLEQFGVKPLGKYGSQTTAPPQETVPGAVPTLSPAAQQLMQKYGIQ